MNSELEVLQRSEDLDFLYNELKWAQVTIPDSAEHKLYLKSKIETIKKRINVVEKSLYEVFG